jgi:hypothetical protein
MTLCPAEEKNNKGNTSLKIKRAYISNLVILISLTEFTQRSFLQGDLRSFATLKAFRVVYQHRSISLIFINCYGL